MASEPFRSVESELTEAEIVRLVTLPEHEWRLALTRVVFDIRQQLESNRELSTNIEEMANRDLAEIKQILNTVKGGLAFFGLCGKFMKWVSIVAGGFTATVLAVKAAESVPELYHNFLTYFWGRK